MLRVNASAFLVSCAALGCSSVERSDPAGDSASASAGVGGAGDAASASSGFGAGGEGGAPFAAGGGTAVSCAVIPEEPLYWMEVGGDLSGDPLLSPCLPGDGNSPGPTARFGGGGECDEGVMLSGCAAPRGSSPGRELSLFADLLGPGTSDLGSGHYQADTTYDFDQLTVSIDVLGEIGWAVTGKYAGVAIGSDGQAFVISGAFSTCRLEDLPPCP